MGTNREFSRREPFFKFFHDDDEPDLSGFHPVAKYRKYKFSSNPVDILTTDKIFFGTDVTHGMIFNRKSTGKVHNSTMDENPGYKCMEKVRCGVQ